VTAGKMPDDAAVVEIAAMSIMECCVMG